MQQAHAVQGHSNVQLPPLWNTGAQAGKQMHPLTGLAVYAQGQLWLGQAQQGRLRLGQAQVWRQGRRQVQLQGRLWPAQRRPRPRLQQRRRARLQQQVCRVLPCRLSAASWLAAQDVYPAVWGMPGSRHLATCDPFGHHSTRQEACQLLAPQIAAAAAAGQALAAMATGVAAEAAVATGSGAAGPDRQGAGPPAQTLTLELTGSEPRPQAPRALHPGSVRKAMPLECLWPIQSAVPVSQGLLGVLDIAGAFGCPLAAAAPGHGARMTPRVG